MWIGNENAMSPFFHILMFAAGEGAFKTKSVKFLYEEAPPPPTQRTY